MISTRRVLFITFHFPPCVDVGAYTCAQIARHLPRYAWEPVVLTAAERYYPVLDHRITPTAEVIRTSLIPHPLRIYRGLKSELVASTGWPASVEKSPEEKDPIRRSVVELLSTPDIYTGWILPALFSAVRAVRRLGISHVVSSGPCWTNHVLGLIVAQVTGRPWTAHFRDPWVDQSQTALDQSQTARRVESGLEKAVVTRAQSVICVTEQHSGAMRDRYPQLPAEKFVTIPNGYDETEWVELDYERPEPVTSDKFVISYTGRLYSNRNPDPVFRAMRRLIDQGLLDIKRVRIDFIGWYEPEQQAKMRVTASHFGLDHCLHIEGPFSKVETFRRMRRSDLLLLFAEGLSMQIPAKTYEYLRVGRPILALTSRDGATSDLLSKTGGAWVVDPGDDTAIGNALSEAYNAWGRRENPRSPDPAAVSEFDRARLTGLFAAILDRQPA